MNRPFVTVDLGLASFLYALGHKIEVTDLGRDRRQFEFSPEAERDVDGYFKGQSIPARPFFSAIRDVKALVKRPAARSTNPNSEPTHAHPTAKR